MPLIQVQILKGRSEEAIQSLISALTIATAENLQVPKERVRIIVQEIP